VFLNSTNRHRLVIVTLLFLYAGMAFGAEKQLPIPYSLVSKEQLPLIPQQLDCTAIEFSVPRDVLSIESLIGKQTLPERAWAVAKPAGSRIVYLGTIPATNVDGNNVPIVVSSTRVSLVSRDPNVPLTKNQKRTVSFLSLSEYGDRTIVQLYIPHSVIVPTKDILALRKTWEGKRAKSPKTPEPFAPPRELSLRIEPSGATFTLSYVHRK